MATRVQTLSGRVDRAVVTIRGHNVILDADLADLYAVETKALLRAVQRNRERFPPDFMFRLNAAEYRNLRYQNGASSSWGGRRYRPFVFTEHGVAMLSGVLRSERAIKANIEIMRAFVRMRHLLSTNVELVKRINRLERKYDARFRIVFDAIRSLAQEPATQKASIGFRPAGRRSAT